MSKTAASWLPMFLECDYRGVHLYVRYIGAEEWRWWPGCSGIKAGTGKTLVAAQCAAERAVDAAIKAGRIKVRS